MGELLPDGSIGSYEGFCPKCQQVIKVNMQGNELGNHTCGAMKLELKKLKDLEIGDKFCPKSQHGNKNITFFIVDGKPQFNIQYGSHTRRCVNLSYQQAGRRAIEQKSCRMEVMFIPKVKEENG